ncbi:MAG: hypothetical protein SYR96_33580 [Actinomycetota bacterium]|nr:hypothetical protein [Actinomycetota bacterium]
MSTTLEARPVAVPVSGDVTVVPVLDGERPVGAWITGSGTATFRPVIDINRLVATALGGAAVIAIALAVAAGRRRSAVGAVTMGPGGWVSIKGAPRPPLRTSTPRPLWARLIGAHPAGLDKPCRRR